MWFQLRCPDTLNRRCVGLGDCSHFHIFNPPGYFQEYIPQKGELLASRKVISAVTTRGLLMASTKIGVTQIAASKCNPPSGRTRYFRSKCVNKSRTGSLLTLL